jgi:hypothetical protein
MNLPESLSSGQDVLFVLLMPLLLSDGDNRAGRQQGLKEGRPHLGSELCREICTCRGVSQRSQQIVGEKQQVEMPILINRSLESDDCPILKRNQIYFRGQSNVHHRDKRRKTMQDVSPKVRLRSIAELITSGI